MRVRAQGVSVRLHSFWRVSDLRRRLYIYENINEKRPRAVFNCLELVAPSSLPMKKNQTYMNKLTTKKQMQMQT